MKEGWEVRKLGEVCEILDKKRKPITKRNRIPGDIPYYGATGILSYVKDYIFDEKIVLLGEDGAKWKSGDNSAFIVEGKSWVNNHAHVLKALPDYMLPEWLVYNLNHQNLMPYVSGLTVPKLNQRNMRSIEIPLPPLPEQKKIVRLLDRAFADIDAATANIERNLENARELFQSRLEEVFGGSDLPFQKLNTVCENLDRQRIPITKSKRESGDVPYYGASGIVDYVKDYIFDEDLLCVSEDGANLLARTYPIAFSISGKTWVNNHAHVLRFSNMVSQKFVEYYLNSIKLDDYVSGMAQPKLNQKKLNSIPVPFPSIEIQKKILGKLDLLKNNMILLEDGYKQKLLNLDDLKKSLLQRAFAGELIK